MLKTGRDFLAIPGPTTVPDRVLNAMHRPAIDIYTGDLIETTERCLAGIKSIMRTEGQAYIYIANGHGAWEAALTNTLSRGDKVLVLGTGRFALGWAEMGAQIGIDFELMDFGWRVGVDPAAVSERLGQDKTGEIKAVLVVQVDTASGAYNDIAAIRAAIDEAGHGALYMVDTIASLATMPYEMDAWGVDVTVAGAQKGLMTPPGLSFVGASKRARKVHESADLRTFYWDWTQREGPLHYQKYCGTPPEHLLFGFDEALKILNEEGLEAIFTRHNILARATWAAFDEWTKGGAISFNIPDVEARSKSVTTVLMPDAEKLDALISFCQDVCNVTIGVGIGGLDGKAFRVAHMGYVNAPMLLGTLGTLEVAFKHLGIAHGSGGVQAAAERIAADVRAYS